MTPTSHQSFTASKHDFAATDRFGRKMGSDVDTYEIDIVAGDNIWSKAARGYLADGHHFVLNVQATRNGIAYGATQYRQFFTTAEARDAAVVKYLRAAQARADKAGS